MTSTNLLLLVCAAIGVQAAFAFSIAFMRHARAHATPAALPALRQEAGAAVEATAAAGWSGWRAMRVAARERADASGSVLSLTLTAADGAPLPRHAPGQYLSVRVRIPADGTRAARTEVRCYSLSDRWHADHYRIAVKRVVEPQPGVVSGHLHDHLQVGDLIEARAPAGNFVLQPGTEPVVLIAGGIGLTPLLAMLETVLAESPARRVWLFYGVRNGADHAMRERLAELAATCPQLRLHVRYSRPRAQDVLGRDHHSTGHLDIGLLRQTLPLQALQFYVCGPGPLLASLVPALLDWGVDPRRIHHEAFGPSSLAPAADAPGLAESATSADPAIAHSIGFARQGRRFDWTPGAGNLLAFAEAHGVALDFSCRAGACGACATRVLAGTVHYPQAPVAEVAQGHCLPCVAQPAGALELDA